MARTSGPTSGLLLALVAAALVVVWLAAGGARQGRDGPTDPGEPPSAPERAAPAPPAALPPREEPAQRETSEEAAAAAPAPEREDTAHLTVRLALGADVPDPPGWRLVVLRDGEPVAAPALAAGVREHSLRLPPGTYSVAADASGYASLPALVVLLDEREIELVLEPLVTLAGAVQDESGKAVEGLPIHWRRALGPSRLDGLPLAGHRGSVLERSAETDPQGGFRLDALVRDAGELLLGDPASPIVPPRPVELATGVDDLGTIVVPALGEAEIRVVDEEDRPVAGIELDGAGDDGGAIRARTDAAGRATARFLPRGVYRVFARDAALGRGNTAFELEHGTPAAVVVRLRRTLERE